VKPLLRNLSLFVAIPSLMASALSGCSGDSDNNNNSSDSSPATSPAQLLQNDLQSLPNISTIGFQHYDVLTDGTFSQIFGGTTANNLVQYLNDRVHYFLTKGDDVSIYPATFANDGWEQDANNTGDVHTFGQTFLADSGGGVVLGAINIGTELWLNGLINNVSVTMQLNDQVVPVDSSRVGIVVLGAGYTDKMSDQNGNSIDVPAFVRQGILLHEARHSDCTGGVTEQDLDVARGATSAQDFAQKTKMSSCGHLHSFCPAEIKPYAGLPACDDEPWGAYSVEATFLSAMSLSDLSEVDKNIALMEMFDRESRVLVGKGGIIYRQADGTPDMSTAGLQPSH
jgi:hypothetical protein